MPFVWVIGDKNNLGLLLPCSMYAVYKRGNFGDWASVRRDIRTTRSHYVL